MKTAVIMQKFYPVVLLMLLSAGLISCSAQDTVKADKNSGDKTLTFYDYKDNDKIYYEVSFDRNNDIVYLSRNGEVIPESEYDAHKDIVYDKLEELYEDSPGRDKVYHFNFKNKNDLKALKHYHKNLITPDIQIYNQWNDSSFKEQMKKMKEEMAKLKDFKVELNFDKDLFKVEMDKLRKEMDPKLNKDLRKLNKELRKMTEELREKDFEIDDIEIDIPEIHIDIENLNKNMRDLDENMEEVNAELKKIDVFMEDVRIELYKDGIIDSKDEDFSMSLNSSRMKINDKEIPSDKLSKYKELYKKHFGKDLKNHERFEYR